MKKVEEEDKGNDKEKDRKKKDAAEDKGDKSSK